jgi:hypothetical protein
VRRSVRATVRLKRGADFRPVDREIRSAGLNLQHTGKYEHEDDSTYELRLVGPARQFDVVTARLLDLDDVLSVQFE